MSERIRPPHGPITPAKERTGLVDDIRSTLRGINTDEIRRRRDAVVAEAVRSALNQGVAVELNIEGRRVTIRCEVLEADE